MMFGQSRIMVVNHSVRKQGHMKHMANIKIKGEVDPMYLRNEVIDLVSAEVGFNPLTLGIYGSRVALDRGNGYYELHWMTGVGEQNNEV